jgi:hypothetical protein
VSFIKSIQDQVWQRWQMAEKKFIEDDATPGTPGHITVGDYVEQQYGMKLREMDYAVKVDYGDTMLTLYTLKNNRLLLVMIACDGQEVREGNP